MSKSTRALAGREQGQFAISTGTSLAIESLANLVPDRPKLNPPPIQRLDIVLINVRTLYRNMLGSLKAVVKQDVLADDIADYLNQEMVQCKDALTKISNSKVEAYFYLCKYENLEKEFPHARLILPNTLKQKQAKDLEDETMAKIIASPEKYGGPKIFDYYVTGGNLTSERVAMLTHIPLDLVNRHQFKELFLLESNTGAFKSHRDFGSKFKVKPENAYFPFGQFTLQVFGDGGKLFAPLETDVIKFVTELSQRFKWTYMTTPDKVKYNLTESGNAKFTSFLKTLLRS